MDLNIYRSVINISDNMVWEVILPPVGAAIPAIAYALKKDGEKRRELEYVYGEFVNRNYLTTNEIVSCIEKLESVRSIGIRTFMKKREYLNALNQKILDREINKKILPVVAKLTENIKQE
jgi:hypothetical protein